MTLEDKVKELIEAKSGSVRAFSIESDVPYTTLRSILERGIMKANVENIFKIAKHLNMKPEQLANLEDSSELVGDILSVSLKLSNDRTQKVYNFAELQLEEQKTVSVYGQTAAGRALEYGQSSVEEETVEYIPKGTDGALNVRGDSMEPLLHDGDLLFFQKVDMVENGEIAVVEINGEAVTTKKVKFDYNNQKIILQSLNDKYDDMVFNDDEVRIIGKVLNK